MMNYAKAFDQALEAIRQESRYRVFADICRERGRFPSARQFHPDGPRDIKAWMGATHFLCRTLPKVASEMALCVLAYNMKRVMQILGVPGLMAAMQA